MVKLRRLPLRISLRLAVRRTSRRDLSLLPIVGVPRCLVLVRSTGPDPRRSGLRDLPLRFVRRVPGSTASDAVDRHARCRIVLVIWLLRLSLPWSGLRLGELNRGLGLVLLSRMRLLRVCLLMLLLLMVWVLRLSRIGVMSRLRRIAVV